MRESDVLDSLGTSARPMSMDVIRHKLRSLVAEVRLQFDDEAAAEAVWQLTEGGDTSSFENVKLYVYIVY